MTTRLLEFISRLWRGDTTLLKAFWVWGVIGVIGLAAAAQLTFMGLLMSGLVSGVLFIGLVITAAILAYLVLVLVGIWRSAGKYSGPRLWKFSARAAVVIVGFLNIASAVLVGKHMSIDTHDPDRNSCNIEARLKTASGYPYTGFWKSSCSDNFGLAIEPVDAGLYSVSFCGPGGCFKPGTYRPNTKIDSDPYYRVVDAKTIEVQGQDGFSRYYLCSPPSMATQQAQSNGAIEKDPRQPRASHCGR
jgi:hypothetical protein